LLATYLSIFRRRVRFIALVTALLAALAFLALTLGADTYRSEAYLVVGADDVVDGVLGQGAAFEEPERRLATEVEIIEGRAVANRAAALLAAQGREEDVEELAERVEAGPRGFANAVEIIGEDTDPERARQLTEAFVQAYIEYQRDTRRAELEALLATLEQRLEAAEVEIAELDAAAAAEPDATAAAREAAVSQYQTVAGWLEGVRLRLAVDPSGLELVSEPTTPEEPEDALPLAVAALASLLGAFLLASGVAFAIELLRDRVRTPEEAAEVGAYPGLVTMPRRMVEAAHPPDLTGAVTSPTTAAARGLRLQLDGVIGAQPRRVLLVGTPEDAADTCNVGLALAAAYGRTGLRTLLVADGLDGGGPVASSGDSAAREAPRPTDTALPAVWSVPATSGAGDDGLLDAYQPAAALDALSASFDAVVFVAPATAQPVEAITLGRLVSTVLVVCAIGRTRARELRRLTESLRAGGTPVLGQVLVVDAHEEPTATSERSAAGNGR
jgi:capsular polysaccharide biosynthesis protein